MNNKHYVGRRAKSVTIGKKLPPVSGVILSGDNDAVFVAGDETGYVVETFVPNATQQMANDLLNKMRGFEYQGYTAQNAFIPPDVELGDGITVKGVYGVLASREYSFTPKMTETISAPYENEDEHEYGYKGNYAQDIAHKVQQGQLYYGTRISKKNGLEIVKTDGNIEKSRVTLNSDTLAFYNDNGQEAFYYDAPSGVFRLTQYANVEDALDGSPAFSQLEFTAQQLQVQINDAKGNISSLQQTASSLQTQISNNDRDISTLTQTASSLQTQISNANGDISSLQQTASSLQTQINNANGDIYSLNLSVNGLSSDVSWIDGRVSSIRQYVDNLTLSVSNGTYSSTIYLDSGRTEISSATITITGMVTFADLSGNGTSTINGANISTGTINANYVNVSGQFAVYEYGALRGYMGVGYGNDGVSTTHGAMLSNANGNNYLIVTAAGTRMTAGGNDLFVTGGGCYASQELAIGSDRRIKDNIGYDMEQYKKLILALKPARFNLKGDPDKLFHTGFIAQEVQETMHELGMVDEEFAGLAWAFTDKDKRYFLRYGEFIAIAISLIQEQDMRIKKLEARL